jgi:uncharacterized protein (UPF0264 family)
MQLLVSITSPAEVLPAVKGGAHILDVKNPVEGTFGASTPSNITQIRQKAPPHIPISAALGDLPNTPGTAALAGLGASIAGASYIKVGLHGVQTLDDAVIFLTTLKQAVGHLKKPIQVIAAGYADYLKINGLSPSDLFSAAAQSKITGVLLDITTKTSASLFDFIEIPKLSSLIQTAHTHGLLVGLAGGLNQVHVSQLITLQPDVVGVRRSVCEATQGDLHVTQKKVRQFRNQLLPTQA